jgi:hypothetical protein
MQYLRHEKHASSTYIDLFMLFRQIASVFSLNYNQSLDAVNGKIGEISYVKSSDE